MLENITPYIPWILCGMLFVVFLILSLKSIIKRRSSQHARNSTLMPEYANTANRTSVGGSPQTSQNSDIELNQNLSIMKSALQDITNQLQGIRVLLEEITYILQNQEGNRIDQPNSSIHHNRINHAQNQDYREPNEILNENMGQEIPTFYPKDEEEGIQDVQSDMDEQISPVLAEFCEIYNTNQQKALQSHYKTHFRFGVVNALDRIQKHDEPAFFENAPNGKYLAFHIQEEDIYAVVPIYDLILDHKSYGPGGFGEVFDCPDFDSKNRYRVKVVQPAFFEPDYAKENWTLMDKGKLALIEI